jgi:hypothetical protein
MLLNGKILFNVMWLKSSPSEPNGPIGVSLVPVHTSHVSILISLLASSN